MMYYIYTNSVDSNVASIAMAPYIADLVNTMVQLKCGNQQPPSADPPQTNNDTTVVP